jgi:hypothetical protein
MYIRWNIGEDIQRMEHRTIFTTNEILDKIYNGWNIGHLFTTDKIFENIYNGYNVGQYL